MIRRFVCAFKHDSSVLAEWSSGGDERKETERRVNAGETGKEKARGVWKGHEGGRGTGKGVKEQ